MQAFQFSTRKSKKVDIPGRPLFKYAKESGNEPAFETMMVQGKKCDSVQEWRTARALDRMKLEYIYQLSIDGGRVPGGQVLDFFVYTRPLPTPVYVQGTYWHGTAKNFDDTLKINRLMKIFGNSIFLPVLVWEKDLESIEEAYRTLSKELGGS